jgi:O-antigen ligase
VKRPKTTILTFWPLLALSLAAGSVVALYPFPGSLALLLIVAIGLIYLYPRAGLSIVVMFVFLETANVILRENPVRSSLPEHYNVVFIPVLITAALVAARKVANPASIQTGKITGHAAILTLLLLWMCTALTWSLDPLHGIAYCFNFAVGLLIYFLCTTLISSEHHVERLFIVLACWGIVVAVAAFVSNKFAFENWYQWTVSEDIAFRYGLGFEEKRAGGFALPQLSGTFMILPLFAACFGLLPKTSRLTRLLLILLSLFLVSNILATGSKASLLALLLGGTFYLLTYPGVRRRFFVTLPCFYGSILALLILNLLLFESDRLTTGGKVHSMSFTFRLDFWRTGLALWDDHWFGMGTGGFSHFVSPWFGAHNIYLEILFDLGVVGLVLLLLFMLSFGVGIVRTITTESMSADSRRYFHCLLAVLLAIAFHGGMDMQYDQALIWLVVGMIAAMLKPAYHEPDDKQTVAPKAITTNPQPAGGCQSERPSCT